MNILSIDTSCDETAAAVTTDNQIVTNIIWSQASQHAEFGGVMPSLAKRMHEEKIDWVVDKALGKRFKNLKGIEAIAVTSGPGLAIALGVGIEKARLLARKHQLPLIAVNHLEGHLLSPFALPHNAEPGRNIKINFPAYGLIVSGGNTLFIKIHSIGKYETLAATTDDALGEALDKAARMLGLGYPGGAILERMSRNIPVNRYNLPVPLAGQENRHIFSYSGLKTALYRLVEGLKDKSGGKLNKSQISEISSSFQNVAFKHLTRTVSKIIEDTKNGEKDLLVGGGVVANLELRKRLRVLSKDKGLKVHFPYTQKMTGDNAAMIGIAAYYKHLSGNFINSVDTIDREANAKIDRPFGWQNISKN